MKKLMLSTAIFAGLATSAFADNHAAGATFRSAADPMIIPASEFVGMRVYASEAALDADEYAGRQDGWEDIGEINEVLLARDGTVDSVLVDIGGFLGIGERQVAVDMSSIRFVSDSATAEDLDDFFLVMNADRSALEGAPAYGMDTDAAMNTEGTSTAVQMEQQADASAAPATGADTAPMAGEATVADAKPMATEPSAEQPQEVAAATEITAEELTGVPVYDSTNEWIGEVSEIILTPEGTVKEAVIDVGGFLGIGEKPVALALDDLMIQRGEGADDLRVQTSLTKEELESKPSYEG